MTVAVTFEVVELVPNGHVIVTEMEALDRPLPAGMVGVGLAVTVEQGLVTCGE